MPEIYTFDRINNFNQEFNDKLHNDYYPYRITLYLDKQINNLEDIPVKYASSFISISGMFPMVYDDSIEFINNQLSYTVSSMHMTEYKNNERNLIYIRIVPNYNILSIDIEIKKHDYTLLHSIPAYLNKDDYGKYIIKSNCFETFDDLIKFIMYDSGLNYELSKKYLIEQSGIHIYYKDDEDIDDNNYYNYNYIILSEGENNEKSFRYTDINLDDLGCYDN